MFNKSNQLKITMYHFHSKVHLKKSTCNSRSKLVSN